MKPETQINEPRLSIVCEGDNIRISGWECPLELEPCLMEALSEGLKDVARHNYDYEPDEPNSIILNFYPKEKGRTGRRKPYGRLSFTLQSEEAVSSAFRELRRIYRELRVRYLDRLEAEHPGFFDEEPEDSAQATS